MNESALPALDDRLAAPTVCLDEAEGSLEIHIDPALSGPEIETAVRLLLDTRPDLRNRGVRLGFSDREVALFDLRRLTRLLAEDYGLTVASVGVSERALLRFAQAELKVQLRVHGAERSWSADTARPVPMAQAHRLDPSACDEGSQAGEPGAFSVFPPIDCAENLPATRTEAEATCAVGDGEALDPLATTEAEDTPKDEAEASASALEDEADPGASAQAAALQREDGAPVPSGAASPGADGDAGRVQTLHRTLRSGVTVRHNGDLIVFGDVNAGAQVVADGNIVVLGSLRGVAHAGARGDETASVVAFDLQSTQVRIASHIALAPERTEAGGSRLRTLLQRDRPSERTFSPEIAQLQGGAIVFGPFRGRLPSAGRP